MKVLITGAHGFVGKNLVATLDSLEDYQVLKVTRETTPAELKGYAQAADFVFHLAGVNRPKKEEEFFEGNVDFTQTLLNTLKFAESKAPIVVTSSIQASNETAYGRSKKAGEDLVFQYGQDNQVPVYIYRLPNLFGKWSKPNYNTVVATFCHQIARGEEITIHDADVELTLVYIDDLLDELMRALKGHPTPDGQFYQVPIFYQERLGHIAELLTEFKASRNNRVISNLNDAFTSKLYSTYLNFLPQDQFAYPLMMHEDERGSFTEFVKSPYGGQVSVNISKPGITRGQHWHHSKNEKFLVVSGQGVIRLRDYYADEIIEYEVTGEKLEVVDIPTGYTHSIVNTGETDMITLMWANEMFDPDNTDTFSLEV